MKKHKDDKYKETDKMSKKIDKAFGAVKKLQEKHPEEITYVFMALAHKKDNKDGSTTTGALAGELSKECMLSMILQAKLSQAVSGSGCIPQSDPLTIMQEILNSSKERKKR